MARVTVTDCLQHVESRFQLILIAAKRARQLIHGDEPKIADAKNKDPSEREKPTVLALREIAAGKIGPEILQEPDVITDLQLADGEQLSESDLFTTEDLPSVDDDKNSPDDESATDEK